LRLHDFCQDVCCLDDVLITQIERREANADDVRRAEVANHALRDERLLYGVGLAKMLTEVETVTVTVSAAAPIRGAILAPARAGRSSQP